MIRNFKVEDIPHVIHLINKCKPFVIPHHEYQYWSLSRYHKKTTFVYLKEEQIVGFLSGIQSIESNSLFIWQICVDSSLRNKNIGLKLLNRMYKSFTSMKLDYIELSITEGNIPSEALFRKFANKNDLEITNIENTIIGESKEKIFKIFKK